MHLSNNMIKLGLSRSDKFQVSIVLFDSYHSSIAYMHDQLESCVSMVVVAHGVGSYAVLFDFLVITWIEFDKRI